LFLNDPTPNQFKTSSEMAGSSLELKETFLKKLMEALKLSKMPNLKKSMLSLEIGKLQLQVKQNDFWGH